VAVKIAIALFLAMSSALTASACKVKDPPPIAQAWSDGFERDDIGGNWRATGAGYRIVDGELSARGAKNHPLWLRKKVPAEVRIEFDAWSNESRGDIKVEVFGDGSSFDPDGGGYVASGYELIFGGWHNSKSMIARLDEHGNDQVQRSDVKVVAKQKYRWRIERSRQRLSWFIDDMTTPFLSYDDPSPLQGDGHDFFAINNWETDTYFDNLIITPLN
jgi:Farnesoic acid 0-methyl transferase